MLWITITITSYLIMAIGLLIDKYLLTSKIPEPKDYAFFIGTLGILILLLIPFTGFYIPELRQIIVSLISGAAFVFGTFWFFKGLKKYEASRIIPAVGGLVPIFTLIITYIIYQGKESFSSLEFWAFLFLVLGTIFISREKKFLNADSLKISLIASLFFGISFVSSKYVFLNQSFWNALIWLKIGGFLFALIFFFPKDASLPKVEKKTVGIFVFGQSLNALANILQNWAVALAPIYSVAIINALQGTQYLFILIATIFLALAFPKWAKDKGLLENVSLKIALQKTISILLIIIGLYLLFMGQNQNTNKKIIWGVNFSQKHAANFGLDWKNLYLNILDDLKIKNIKIAFHWDIIEPQKDNFYFEDTDWQINEAQKRGVKIIPVIGMKTSRWPECHIPDWAKNLSKEEQKERILKLIDEMIKRYGDERYKETIKAWQVENEPLFPFGECPWYDKEFLKKEADFVRSVDPYKRPVIISETGEWSTWFTAAKISDILGVTMYQRAWFEPLKMYVKYPFPPAFYSLKAWIIEKFLHKKTICIELQAEPWGQVLLYDLPIEEGKKTMTPKIFDENIKFARQTGFDEFYLWGVEWWYFMKEKQNDKTYWDKAKELFKENI